ncbi:MAG: ABC transporter substrate-binding protein [Suilimivivens sp.]
MLKKISLFGVGMIAVILLLIGCGREEHIEQVEITLMHGWGGTLQTHKIMQEIYEEFEQQNPDIKLNCIPYSSNAIAVEKANDMLAVGKAPDILSTNGLSYYISNAIKCNEAMDLMPYIEEDPAWKSQIHPAVFDTWKTEQGNLYTLPDALEVAGYWYNEEYLTQAGIVDEAGDVKIPKTWDEFMAMAEQIQSWIDETGQNISVFALESDQIIEFLFLARIAGISEEGMKLARSHNPVLDEQLLEEALRGIEKLYQYSQEVNSVEDARQCFRNGASVIYFNGVWEADELSKSTWAKAFQYANYPTYDGRSLSYVSPSSGYVVSKQNDERKERACVRFLKYMLSEEVQEKIALETGQAPSKPNVNVQDILKKFPLFGNALNIAGEAEIQIETIRSVWNEEQMDQLNQCLIRWIEDVRNKR